MNIVIENLRARESEKLLMHFSFRSSISAPSHLIDFRHASHVPCHASRVPGQASRVPGQTSQDLLRHLNTSVAVVSYMTTKT